MKNFVMLNMLLITNICYSGETMPKKVYEYFSKTRYKKVAHVITAMGALESGWFKNPNHVIRNNYFSLKDWKDPMCKVKPIACMRKFDNFNDCLDEQLDYFKRKGYRTTEENFLKDIVKKKYAEDPKYIEKLKSVTGTIKRKLNKETL